MPNTYIDSRTFQSSSLLYLSNMVGKQIFISPICLTSGAVFSFKIEFSKTKQFYVLKHGKIAILGKTEYLI